MITWLTEAPLHEVLGVLLLLAGVVGLASTFVLDPSTPED